jgi:hypothetical protein
MKSSGIDLIRSRQFTYAEWSCGDQKDKAKALATLRLGNVRGKKQIFYQNALFRREDRQ